MPDRLDPHLEPLRPLLGRTFRGELPTAGDKVATDISRWERALGGRAVRNLHSLDDGEYGGETIIYWDETAQTLACWYFTTAGFWTRGTVTFAGNRIISEEEVTGNESGVTEILPDGGLSTHSEYLRNGEWVAGHGGRYREDPTAEVHFH